MFKPHGGHRAYGTKRKKEGRSIVTLVANKINFKTKNCNNRQGRTLHNDKGVSPKGRHNK